MKVSTKLLILIFVFFGLDIQAQLNDDFSDGDFSSNPTWTGMDTNFSVQSEVLKLDDKARTFESYLSTPLQLIDSTEWNFLVEFSFNPSSSNQAFVYLVSDSADLSDSLTGYFVRIGGTKDEISLFRQDNLKNTANATLLIDGQNGLISQSSVSVRVRVRRDSQGNWELWSDPTGNENFISEGVAQDTTYKQNSHFGILCDYTSTRSKLFSFDDIYAGAYIVDTSKPKIVAINAISLDSIIVSFSEKLATGPANLASNFSLQTGPSVQGAALGNDSSFVSLKLFSDLLNGQSYSLSAINQTDLFGNVSSSLSSTLQVRISEAASFQDIIINEFMADPSPPVSLPEVEYVELYNRSNKFINLNSWEFSDASSTVRLDDYWFEPNTYLILCNPTDSSLLSAYGTILSVSGLPSLNNTGDLIKLEDSSATVIDELTYSLSWYKDPTQEAGGFSLEKINPFSPCDGAANWKGSLSLDGGTPGMLNAAFDTNSTIAPIQISSVTIINSSSFRVEFDNTIDTSLIDSAFFNALKGQVPDLISLSLIGYGTDFLELEFPAGIDTGLVYSIIFNKLTDCAGGSFGRSYQNFGIGAAPSLFDLVISEIYPIPTESNLNLPDEEFIEIYNRSDLLINLSALKFHDASNSGSVNEGVIAPNTYAVLCPTGSESLFEKPFRTVVGVSSWPSLNNTGDELKLTNQNDELIHFVNYDDLWFEENGDDSKSEGGWSLEMKDLDNTCEGQNNWAASTDNRGATIGEANSVAEENPDQSIPFAEYCFWIDDSTIYLQVSEFVFNMEKLANNFSIVDENSISANLKVDSISLYNENLRSTYLLHVSQSNEQNILFLNNENISDCAGNKLENSKIRLPVPLEKTSLSINEVLFNPFYSDGADFIELYVSGQNAFRLDELIIASFDNEKRVWKDQVKASENPALIYPKEELTTQESSSGFLVLTEEPLEVYRLYRNPNFEGNSALSIPNTDGQFESLQLPSLNNDESDIYLLNLKGDTIDHFAYTDEFHHPLLEDVDGISLEKYSVLQISDDERNWTSATEGPEFGEAVKGSPGKQNSVARSGASQEKMFSVDPELFIPSINGQFQSIRFNFNLQANKAFAASLTIFTDQGIELIKLLDNEPIASQSSRTWNGFLEDGSLAKTGPYIAVFEAFEPNGYTLSEKQVFTIAPSN